MAFPVGFHFRPTELALVRSFLRRKVEQKESDMIRSINLYEKDPWRLDHDPNPLYYRNEWYYFVKRTKRGAKTVNRSVQRSEESEGGTWKATGTKTEIKHEKVVYGYKQSLVYKKKVNGKTENTDWLMMEYSLCNGSNEFQDMVLCRIRFREKVDERLRLVPHAVEENNNVLWNQDQEEEEDDDVFASDLENMMLEEEPSQRFLLPPPTTQSNMMMSNEEPSQRLQSNNTRILEQGIEDIDAFIDNLPPWGPEFDFDYDITIDQDELMAILDEDNDVAHQQQREEERLQLLQPMVE